jgi:hypothetical protein
LRSTTRDFQAAKALLEEARPHLDATLKGRPGDQTFQQNHRTYLAVLVPVTAGLGDAAAAKQIAYKLRDLGWDPPNEAYDAACALSLCIRIVQSNDKASQEDRDRQASNFGNEAMGLLREAVGNGFNDAAHMKQDKDLDALREREDFKKLLAELETNKR